MPMPSFRTLWRAAPAGPALPQPIADTFTGADGTPLDGRALSSGGGAWRDLHGDWQLLGNGARSTTAVSGSGNAVVTDLGSPTQDVTVNVTWGNRDNDSLIVDGYAGLVVRSDPDAYTQYECYIACQLGRCDITEKSGPTTRTNRAMSGAFTPVYGQTYTLRVTAIGNTISFYVDGVLKCSYASASFNNTKTHVGLWTWDQISVNDGFQNKDGDDKHRFDNFAAS